MVSEGWKEVIKCCMPALIAKSSLSQQTFVLGAYSVQRQNVL